MVKKLLKYEFRAMFKRLLPLCLIVFGTALLNRVLQFFENDSTTYKIVFISSVVLLVLACLVLLIGTVVIAVSRYYNHLFTAEGYLTMSLPVTAEQHVFSKTLTGLVCCVISVIVCFLGVSIAVSGEMLAELLKAGAYLMKYAGRKLGNGNMVFYTIEAILGILLSLCNILLLFYACISLGQRGKKNRVGLAVGVFFIYYFAMQVLGTIFVIIMAILDANGMLAELVDLISNHVRGSIHVFMLIGIVWNILFGILYAWISVSTLKKRLNLE